MAASTPSTSVAEWPTLALIGVCYGLWGGATFWASSIGLWWAVPLAALAVVLHSSLQHEVIHGHPLPSRAVSTALVYPALGLFVPFGRFRDTHLAHHRNETLTDPYDDPESCYLDPAVWRDLPRPVRAVLLANNTLAGRVVLGPLIGLAVFIAGDVRAMGRGDRVVLRAWALHAPALAPVVFWLGAVGTMPGWAAVLAAYLGMGVLKIRTFLEHRAHDRAGARSVIVEDRGPLALLFLNNNYHALHHALPSLPWYRLPAVYRDRRGRVLAMNDGYCYRSYGAVMRRYLWRTKEPVAHPCWPWK